MRKGKMTVKKTWMKGMLGLAVFVTAFALNVFASNAAEGKVIADTAKIRAEASTTSAVVGSTERGKTIDIVGAAQDSSGMKWYKVPISGNSYGYIRSDLVETSETIAVSETSQASAQGGSQPAATVPTSIGEQAATVSVASATIRSGASTQHSSIASLPQGTVITLVGEASDSSGKKWYQMKGESGGRTIEGYIRSDLITLGGSVEGASGEGEGGENPEGGEGENPEGEGGENPEGAPEEPVEPVEPAEPEHKDFEVVYLEDAYWLNDYTSGNRMQISNLLAVVEENSALQAAARNEKIIIIVLAVIIVLLVIAVTILIFKLKDAYYYEEEYDEEEEEEIEEEMPAPRKKRRASAEDYPREQAPAKGTRTAVRSTPERPEQGRAAKRSSASSPELQAAERKQPAKRPPQRKAQNFLVDDDEFEFEFLNIDDKDL